MPVIAILGAGPDMGLAIARTFGNHGFSVAFLSHNPTRLEPVLTELTKEGIEAAAFRADVLEPASIAAAFTAAKQHFGTIDVLEFSPADGGLPLVPATELMQDNVQVGIDFYLHGAVEAVHQVLPEMLNRRSGTILFTTGASPAYPHVGDDTFGHVALTMAALRSWAHSLHAAVAAQGVQVGHVAIVPFMGGEPGATPDAIAPLYWELYTQRQEIERVFMLETSRHGSA